MIHFLLSAGLDTLRTMIYAAIVIAPFMIYKRTRHVIIALVKLTIRKSPTWAKWLIVIAQYCPTQADDVIVFAIVLIPILRHRLNRATYRRVISYAWNV